MSKRRHRFWPTAFGLSMLGIYLGWNVRWLAVGRIPPSLLTGITGLPSPTTGGTRSMLFLLDGDVGSSLYYNPMSLPIVVLTMVTLVQVVRYGYGKNWLVPAWVTMLSVAWAIKLLSPTETW